MLLLAVLSFVVGVALPLGFFGWILLRALRVVGTFACPRCVRQVVKAAIRTDGILCPLCGWYAAEPAHSAQSISRSPYEAPCHFCGNTTLSGEGIELWDGKLYCRPCVDEHSLDLAEYAQQHAELKETLSLSAWTMFWWTYAWLLLAIVGVMACFGLLVGLLIADILTGLMFPLLFLLLGIPLCALYAGIAAYGLAINRPTTTLAGGELRVRFGETAERVCSLSECEWYVGNLSHVTLGGKTVLPPWRAAVILALPRQEGDDETIKVPVSSSEETLPLWIALLTLARVPKRSLWTKLSWRRTALDVAVMGLAFPVCFVGGMFLARFITLIASHLLPNAWQDIAQAIGFFFFVPGCLSAMIYIWILWPCASRYRVPTKRTLKQQRSGKLLVRITIALVGAFVGAQGFFAAWTLPASCFYFGLCVAWGWFFGRHLASLVYEYDWETARPSDLPEDCPGHRNE